eukprot:317066_1
MSRMSFKRQEPPKTEAEGHRRLMIELNQKQNELNNKKNELYELTQDINALQIWIDANQMEDMKIPEKDNPETKWVWFMRVHHQQRGHPRVSTTYTQVGEQNWICRVDLPGESAVSSLSKTKKDARESACQFLYDQMLHVN